MTSVLFSKRVFFHKPRPAHRIDCEKRAMFLAASSRSCSQVVQLWNARKTGAYASYSAVASESDGTDVFECIVLNIHGLHRQTVTEPLSTQLYND